MILSKRLICLLLASAPLIGAAYASEPVNNSMAVAAAAAAPSSNAAQLPQRPVQSQLQAYRSPQPEQTQAQNPQPDQSQSIQPNQIGPEEVCCTASSNSSQENILMSSNLNMIQKIRASHAAQSPYDDAIGTQPIDFRVEATNFSGCVVPSLQQSCSLNKATLDCGYFALYNALSFVERNNDNSVNRPSLMDFLRNTLLNRQRFINFLRQALDIMTNYPDFRQYDGLEEKELRYIIRTLQQPVVVLTVYNLLDIVQQIGNAIEAFRDNREGYAQEEENVFAAAFEENTVANKISTHQLLSFLRGITNNLVAVVFIPEKRHWVAVNVERRANAITFTIADSMFTCSQSPSASPEIKRHELEELLAALFPYHSALANSVSTWGNIITAELCGLSDEGKPTNRGQQKQNQLRNKSSSNMFSSRLTRYGVNFVTTGSVGLLANSYFSRQFLRPMVLSIPIAVAVFCCSAPVWNKSLGAFSAWLQVRQDRSKLTFSASQADFDSNQIPVHTAKETAVQSDEAMTYEFAEHLMYDAPEEVLGIQEALNDNTPVRKIFLGEPGVGKTLTAQALALLSGRQFVCVKSSELITKWQGSGSTNLAAAVEGCLCSSRPSIIILDEMKPLAGNDNDTTPADRLLEIMNKVANNPRVAFIATANTLDDVPPAVKSRFQRELGVVNFPLPGTTVLASALEHHIRIQKLRSKKLIISDDCLDAAFLNNLAKRFAGFTQRDTEALVDFVAIQGQKKRIAATHKARVPGTLINDLNNIPPIVITQQDFVNGVREAKKRGKGWVVHARQFCNDHPALVEFGANLAVNGCFHALTSAQTERHYKQTTQFQKERVAIEDERYKKANEGAWNHIKQAGGSLISSAAAGAAGAGATWVCNNPNKAKDKVKYVYQLALYAARAARCSIQ